MNQNRSESADFIAVRARITSHLVIMTLRPQSQLSQEQDVRVEQLHCDGCLSDIPKTELMLNDQFFSMLPFQSSQVPIYRVRLFEV